MLPNYMSLIFWLFKPADLRPRT